MFTNAETFTRSNPVSDRLWRVCRDTQHSRFRVDSTPGAADDHGTNGGRFTKLRHAPRYLLLAL